MVAAGGAGFSASDVKAIYFGNWLRDFSQLPKHPAVLAIIDTLAAGEFGGSFTAADLGTYVPSEHWTIPKAAARSRTRRSAPIPHAWLPSSRSSHLRNGPRMTSKKRTEQTSWRRRRSPDCRCTSKQRSSIRRRSSAKRSQRAIPRTARERWAMPSTASRTTSLTRTSRRPASSSSAPTLR